MTLNGVMAVTLRYFTEFGKHTFQHITAAVYSNTPCKEIHATVEQNKNMKSMVRDSVESVR